MSRVMCLPQGILKKFENNEEINWFTLCEAFDIPFEVLSRYHHKVNWWAVTRYQTLSEEFLDQFEDYIYWNSLLIRRDNLPDSVVLRSLSRRTIATIKIRYPTVYAKYHLETYEALT